MNKIILLLLISPFLFSCSSANDEKESTTLPPSIIFNKLKAYNKLTAFYYYSPDATRVGISRIYLDTINGGITQYTSHRETNQSDTSEKFVIKESELYKNYNNTNIDYMLYKVNYMQTYEVNFDPKRDNPFIIILSHDGSGKYIFYRIYADSKELFFNNFQNTEYYKKLGK